MFVSHPWIQSNTIESRTYQEDIVQVAIKDNTLVVLPTGLGKTSIAALVAAHRFQEDMNTKILFLAPTKPLVEQHRRSFERFLKIGPSELQVVTGENKPESRKALYAQADVIFSTPQTIENDLEHGLINLSLFSLCIFDEAHHCVGNYSYTKIARLYMQQATRPLILALTASPGGQRYKIEEVKQKLFIKQVEIRTRLDPDVRPYMQELNQEWITVELDPPLLELKDMLERVKKERVETLLRWRIIHSGLITKSQLIALQIRLAQQKSGSSFAALSIIAQIIKVDHALLLLETQTLFALDVYLRKFSLDESRAASRLLQDMTFKTVVQRVRDLVSNGAEHPKLFRLRDLIIQTFTENKNSSVIIFAQYRDTIQKIQEVLKTITGVSPVMFIGQAKKNGIGLSQKEQVAIIGEFRMGFYNVLCASQVAEEGLDITETNLVVFYEPTASAVRKIQRTGRTARTQAGKVTVLMTKNTRDEAYHWSAHHKEKKMHTLLSSMQQKRVMDFA